ncbi:hypothetical protein HMPREF1624_02693 [Sporothrix schenckii ATCC 58251]|uniref:Apple domain-containing protein n=1 Tax=Sporothrix schenckii (strain ATCC 58251 / de Perez 2211183) TaxID=1391915 RepID=U7Q0N4_SPOS1|nr:hypothetical protein HMPREF1624_02693 [Sporothrix schenckii ATCC 58251]
MKSRRNTPDSEAEANGSKPRASRATQDSALSGMSVEMNAWTRRNGSSQSNYSSSHGNNDNTNVTGFPQPRSPNTATAPLGQLPIVPVPQAVYQSTYRRASSSSSQDGRNSGRGSRGNGVMRPTPVPAFSVDGEEMYFPLSPAPPKRKSDTGTRLTHGSESDVLPPEDRNYPVPVFNAAQFQLPPQQEPLPQQQPQRQQQQQNQQQNQQQQPSSTHLRIIHASATGPPSIYWSDDGASAVDSTGGGNNGSGNGGGAETATFATATNPSAFTFYREGTPPPGHRNLSDDDDDDDDDDYDDDDNGAIQTEKLNPHRSQFREIGLAVSTPKHSSNQKTTASGFRDLTGGSSGAGSGGGGGGNGRRPGQRGGADEEDDMNREEGNLAEIEFVNGRYVPPGLREGRMPGRKPVSENHDDASDSYYERDRSGRQFWYVAGFIVFLILAVAIGVGVGVGIGLSKKSSDELMARPNATAPAATASSSAASGVGAAAATLSNTAAAIVSTLPTAATSSSSSPSSTSTSLTDCPAANGTTYNVPGSGTTFLRLCGIDFSGTGAAVDLSHLPTTSMDDCMNNCAGTSGCTACGWGPANSSTTSSGVGSSGFENSGKNYFQCYLKSTLGSIKTAVYADSDWCFAIMQ